MNPLPSVRGSRVILAVALALLAFAGNSLLARLALRDGGMDPASFTALRLASGALVLWLLASAPEAQANLRAQAAVAHNLANVETTGFKAALATTEAFQVQGPGQPTRAPSMALPRRTPSRW